MKELTELPGPVGHERPVADHLVERWARIRRGTPTATVQVQIWDCFAGDNQRWSLDRRH
ncbi:hypothetical protein [Sphaerisporangium sp. NPDC051011]|uniref:RICIN domain-containing protein n=1 Tax=Sphaerisporangium sp. NPDC051011 TaxID=3155792 RepID=UPI0033D7BF46